LVQQGVVQTARDLEHWLEQELSVGAIRFDAIAIRQIHDAVTSDHLAAIPQWNAQLSALRETEELRHQNWQMGRSLSQLLRQLSPSLDHLLNICLLNICPEHCNFATAFAIAAAHWQVDRPATLLAYLQSWASNLTNAGVRLIPLGQTQGQQVLMALYPTIQTLVERVLETEEVTLDQGGWGSCSWGLAIASMQHETLYSRLFRS
jgi:urease accessory protein